MTEVTASDDQGEQDAIASEQPLSETEAQLVHAYWRAANYLSVGQIYLLDNPLLREPLKPEHVKARLLGHWGTTPGLNFIYAHMNRVIRNSDLDAIYVMGPGHGGPAAVANAYLEGTYSELYPGISCNEDGMRALFRQFSFPGGIPSHVAPETPGSIHEGGELGYALSHAFGAAFDTPVARGGRWTTLAEMGVTGLTVPVGIAVDVNGSVYVADTGAAGAIALNRALADAAPLDQEIALRTQQAATIDQRLRNLEDGAKTLDDAQRERLTLEELVHTYRTRYEEARMSEDLDRNNLVSVSIVQQASAPARPAGPHPLPYALAGILIGIIGASGVLIYLLVFRVILITVESVERIIGVPVLASVPTSRPPGNDNREAA